MTDTLAPPDKLGDYHSAPSRFLMFIVLTVVVGLFAVSSPFVFSPIMYWLAGTIIGLIIGYILAALFDYKQQHLFALIIRITVDSVIAGLLVGLLGVSLGGVIVLGMLLVYLMSSPTLRQYSGYMLTCFVLSIASYILYARSFSVHTEQIPSIYALLAVFSYVLFIIRKQYLLTKQALAIASDFEYKYSRQLDISSKIAKYMPSQLAHSILAGRSIHLSNRRRRVSVFFSDIIGFTELSERLDSEDLANFLNTYMEEMGGIAKQFGGTIDKFVGDAMMVFFGDPDSNGVENDALKCVEMAIAMRRKISLLQVEWQNQGFPGLSVRMGISSGYAHVGNFGHSSRLSYTAIGSEVNLAARLQSESSPNEILISESTFALVSHRIGCTPKPALSLKGFDGLVTNWQVVDTIDNIKGYKRPWYEANNPNFFLQVNMAKMTTKDQKQALEALEEGIRLLQINMTHPSKLK